ncbi:hypothetical protein [Rhizobacter fulvus]|jgi:hypothetical protein
MSNLVFRTALRERADLLEAEAQKLRALADEMFPLTEAEKTTREIEDDDRVFLAFLLRVHRAIELSPHMTAAELARSMGLPDKYPSPGSNYFSMELLNYLERFGMVTSNRHEKPFTWVARPIPKLPVERILGSTD